MTETTTSTKYVLEGRGEKFGANWVAASTPCQSAEQALSVKRFYPAHEEHEYRIVEIVTTTTVSRKVVDENGRTPCQYIIPSPQDHSY